jgi:hypothetical protein
LLPCLIDAQPPVGMNMDKEEARSVLREHLRTHRTRSYADLSANIGNAGCVEVAGPSGLKYQIEVDVLWDHKPGGNIESWQASMMEHSVLLSLR